MLFINLDQWNICFGQQQAGGGIICLEGGQSLQKKPFIFLHSAEEAFLLCEQLTYYFSSWFWEMSNNEAYVRSVS